MNQEEQNYLDLMQKIITCGSDRSDRTGIGTKSIFGAQLRFSLANNKVPILTTKKMFIRGIIEELLFFIRGETDTKKLEAKGVNIWKGNTSREFLDKRGLTNLPEGYMGPMYGKMWRNFHGIDQLDNALQLIKTDPNSRRIMITAYDPSLSHLCVLDPCHTFFQFYVNNKKISLHLYIRSSDVFLGLPFNILSYAILLKIFAKASKLEADDLIISIGDAHCYNNHIEQVTEQITRKPLNFPNLFINKEVDSIHDMEALSFDDFRIDNYISYSALKAAMAT